MDRHHGGMTSAAGGLLRTRRRSTPCIDGSYQHSIGKGDPAVLVAEDEVADGQNDLCEEGRGESPAARSVDTVAGVVPSDNSL